MPQVFPRWTNVGSKMSIFGVLTSLALVTWASMVYVQSSYGTNAGLRLVQPVPFSHQHHVGGLGIDCRYCHTSVEQSAFAGMPETKTCMNCHSQIWVGSEMLRPVRESYATDRSIAWERVYNTPGFVYFAHHIHVQKGIGCSSCHGRIDRMAFTEQAASLLMEWCLECHRDPASQIRPRPEVFNMDYRVPTNQRELGEKLVAEYDVRDPKQLTSCSTCHR
ncbi:MAG: cytochrome c3 family protein [Planctomycetia bacterium]|nr:cytochrome c3 family protein [Planctomycetia bacterium]